MPYFERKPYVETLANIVPMPGPASDPSILTLADAVLGSESQVPALEGPFRARKAVKPGQTASLVLTFSADPGTGDTELGLKATRMRGAQGGEIPATAITLNPAAFTLAAGEQTDVHVSIAVPADAAAGLYSGQLQAQGGDPVSVRVELTVTD